MRPAWIGCLVVLAACGGRVEQEEASPRPEARFAVSGLLVADEDAPAPDALATAFVHDDGTWEGVLGDGSRVGGTKRAAGPRLEGRAGSPGFDVIETSKEHVVLRTRAGAERVFRRRVGYRCPGSDDVDLVMAGAGATMVTSRFELLELRKMVTFDLEVQGDRIVARRDWSDGRSLTLAFDWTRVRRQHVTTSYTVTSRLVAGGDGSWGGSAADAGELACDRGE